MLLSTVGPTWKGLARPLAYVAVAIVAAIFLLSLTSFNVSAHGRTPRRAREVRRIARPARPQRRPPSAP